MEKSIYHFKHSGPEADREDIAKAKMVQTHLNKCTEAKRLRDWNGLITETTNTISSGADAAPQVYALQAEALLKTHRHQEADDALSRCPVFDGDTSTRYYGPVGYAGFLVVRAQVHLASGRFVLFCSSLQILVYYIYSVFNLTLPVLYYNSLAFVVSTWYGIECKPVKFQNPGFTSQNLYLKSDVPVYCYTFLVFLFI